MEKNIFDAARSGDIALVNSHIRRGANLIDTNEFGFTALHCVAMGCATMSKETALAMIDLLLNAGSPVNAISQDGRTVLFLAAEFSQTVEPLQKLIQAGGDVDIRDPHGNHIVTNARTKQSQEFLSTLSGHPIPEPITATKPVPLSAAEWLGAKSHLDKVFEALSKSGFIALQDAGFTQDDGFSDCLQDYQAKGGKQSGLSGFCFYTRQDLSRAKRSSQLSIAFWGAPDGSNESTCRIGQQIVDAFRKHGFIVDWSGSPDVRPTVNLKAIAPKVG